MSRRVLVAVPDLFFVTRIRALAGQLGVTLEECAPAAIPGRCADSPPDLLILDLHAPGDPLAQVRALKADERTRAVTVVGFYSHVDAETRRLALEAGVDRVMPRSAFTAKLHEILAGGS